MIIGMGVLFMIVAKNISKVYNNKITALDEFELSIGQGLFGLLGPNGSGKTTFMRIITTLLKPTKGTVEVCGNDVMKQPDAVRRLIGYVPQEFGLPKKLTVTEFLDYVAILKGIKSTKERIKQIDYVVQNLSLEEFCKRKIWALSGGMKQRVGVAQALLGKPKVLIVDEPSVGLDPKERVNLRNLLGEISTTAAVILSTHIVEDVQASCSNMAVINNGKIVYYGSPEKLRELAKGKVWSLSLTNSEFQEIKQLYRVTATKTKGSQIIARVLSGSHPLGKGTMVEPELEDGYLLVTGGS